MSTNSIGNQPPSSLLLSMSNAELTSQLGGDVNAQAAAMMLKHGHEKRTTNSQLRSSQEDRLRSVEDQQVSKMREQAVQTLVAGRRRAMGMIVSGSLGIASGAVTMGSAGAAGKAAGDAGKHAGQTADQAAKAAQAAETARRTAETARGVSQSLDGAGATTRGVMDLWATSAEHEAQQRGVDAKVAENKAGEAKRRLEDLKDEESGARDLIRTALDFLRNVKDTEGATERAALSQRA